MRLKLIAAMTLAATMSVQAEDVQLFSYSASDGGSGLRLAWRADQNSAWQPIGNGYDFVKSDFGPWGSHKRMFNPRLICNSSDGMWTLTWNADQNGTVGLVTSPDLKKWNPQRYFSSYSNLPKDLHAAYTLTADSASINGKTFKGWRQTVDKKVIDTLNEFTAERARLGALYGEQAKDDNTRFAGLKPLKLALKAQPSKSKPISDKLIGIFFEDINYGADGGLYGELIQNRDFEYAPSDRGGDKQWNPLTAWTLDDASKGTATIADSRPVHKNNANYLAINPTLENYTVTNSGYDGIALTKGDSYRLSIMARAPKGAKITARLVDASGKAVGKGNIKITPSENWDTYRLILKSSATTPDANLQLVIDKPAPIDLDMVSLFPVKTFKGRENGLRADLAQTLADLKPRFVRFPGGCVAHGDGVDNIYDWKGSVGPLHERKPLRNLWGYHQTRGLGYHEYFQFCEDIGAEPVPVLAAGVPCQNSGTAAHHTVDVLTQRGQQCGIPMEEMDQYIQDVLDLIEYANGSVDTPWGAKRAAAGHPDPFNLKYLGIGNEDMITEVFEPRFKLIYDAVRKAHPEITVIGTVGPFYEGTDYDRGWELANQWSIPIVDEHYYVQPGWMIYNQDYYDNYKRGANATQVYLGEYAAHLPGRPNNIETALAEALYLTSVERNGDVVAMTSYAPLLAKKGHTQWTPDMIYFDNTNVDPTVGYFTQKMYGQNSGTRYVPAVSTLDNEDPKVKARVASSIVIDETSGDCIVKLVNMLPVSVDANVDIAAVGLKPGKATCTVLTGAPDDKSARPVTSSISSNGLNLPYTMPPYSFTVIRLENR